MDSRFGKGTALPDVFYYDNNNQTTEPSKDWDLFLGNMGVLPKHVEQYIYDITDEEKKASVKYALCDISQAVLKQNIEIWKYRCKRLYGPITNKDPP